MSFSFYCYPHLFYCIVFEQINDDDDDDDDDDGRIVEMLAVDRA